MCFTRVITGIPRKTACPLDVIAKRSPRAHSANAPASEVNPQVHVGCQHSAEVLIHGGVPDNTPAHGLMVVLHMAPPLASWC